MVNTYPPFSPEQMSPESSPDACGPVVPPLAGGHNSRTFAAYLWYVFLYCVCTMLKVLRVSLAAVSRAPICSLSYIGAAIPIRIKMIAITINSSISEKPRDRLFARLPSCIRVYTYYDADGASVVQAGRAAF